MPLDTNGRFLVTLHPLSVCAYVFTLGLLAVIWAHPLFLGVLLLTVWMLIRQLGGWAAWHGYLRFVVPFLVLLVLVNPLFAGTGQTIFWTGPKLPGFGSIQFSLEGLLFSLTMGLRLLVVLGAFLVYSLALNPDRLLGLTRRPAPRVVLIILLATRLYPALADDYRNVKDAFAARGLDFDGGGLFSRFRSHLTVFRAVLVSALERALEIAEAMFARHYGMGPRTAYRTEVWRPRDSIVAAATVLLAGTGLASVIRGASGYVFYPVCSSLLDTTALAGVMAAVPWLLVPVLLGGGWQHWDSFKSRI